jgi:signal transduction histidine kinase
MDALDWGEPCLPRRPPPGALAGEACLLAEELLAGRATRRMVVERARALSGRTGQAQAAVAADLYALVVRDPRVLSIEPARALAAQLEALLLFAPVSHASLWLRESGECLASRGEALSRQSLRRVARLGQGVGGNASNGAPGLHAVPVGDEAALLVRPKPRRVRAALGYAAEAASALVPLLERRRLLASTLEVGRRLLDASERRIARLGFDLHDGPLQELALLLGELPGWERELAQCAFDEGARRSLERRLARLGCLLRALEQDLRALAVSAGGPAATRSLRSTLEREVDSFRRRAGLAVRLVVEGDVERSTPSQRIAVARIVEEALANVREHAQARRAEVSVLRDAARLLVRVADDGVGFDPAQAERSASRAGRLGLLAMGERARLLGGYLGIESKPGGPTVVTAVLPAWDPPRRASRRKGEPGLFLGAQR